MVLGLPVQHLDLLTLKKTKSQLSIFENKYGLVD